MKTKICIKCSKRRLIKFFYTSPLYSRTRLSTCKDCLNQHRKQRRIDNPEVYRETLRKRRLNKDAKDRANELRRMHYANNSTYRDRVLSNQRRWHAKADQTVINRINERCRKRYQQKPHVRALASIQSTNRRRSLDKRTPSWCDLESVKIIYLRCPKGYEVDHIIPTQGELVSGLHVPENLQHLTRFANRSKGNKFNPMEFTT